MDPMAEELQAELTGIFREEAAEAFDQLSGSLEELATGTPDERIDALEDCLRIAHNMKGASSIVGIDDLSQLAHRMEDVLVPFRKSGESLSPELLGLLLESVTLAHRLAEGEKLEEQTHQQIASLGTWLEGGASEPTGDDSEARRDSEEWAEPEADEAVSRDGPSSPGAQTPLSTATREAAPSSVRVESNRLDRLMAQAGELLIAQARLVSRKERMELFQHRFFEIGKSLSADAREDLADLALELNDLVELEDRHLREFGHLTEQISTAMKEIRMLPLASMAAFWRRVVRESAQEASRAVRLEIEVGEVEIDKEILDALREPFLHLLRNAVDHGIEPPEERQAAGKAGQGSITIRAAMAGSMVQLTVQDDGRGIDAEKVAASALEKGLVSHDRLARMSEDEILGLLFASGFSTRDRVSRLSGRGVGLDVVSHRLAELGGDVRIVRGEGGQGTRFELLLPLSLLSIRALLVRSAETVCALPIESVDRTLRIEKESVQQIEGMPAIEMEGKDPLALRYLSAFLGQSSKTESKMHRIVVITRGGSRLGLVVDEILGDQEFVTRRLPWNLEDVPGISGAMILPDGSVGTVMDVGFLFEGRETSAEMRSPAREEAAQAYRVLVVDDSLTSRTLERGILLRAGYDVTTASDGEEAWEILKAETFDLLVSDVEMPRLDGFELTRRVRRDPSLRELPVVLVTSLGNEKQIREGSEAGADEYIVKGQFEQAKLLEAVARHL